MPISDELVELACAAEQASGPCRWPEEWIPELAEEYRAGMRLFLSSIVPFIEAAALEEAARIAESHAAGRGSDPCADQAMLIAACIRNRMDEVSTPTRLMGWF